MNPQFFDILRRAIFLIFGLTSLSCAIWHWRKLRLAVFSSKCNTLIWQ